MNKKDLEISGSEPGVSYFPESFPGQAHPPSTLRRRDFAVGSSTNFRSRSNKEDFSDSQFKSQFYDTCGPPVHSIVRAVLLLVIGSILTIIGSLLLAGYFDSVYADRTWPVLTLGLLCFVPGFYYSRIAYYAHKGYPGYSYSDIPSDE